MTDSDSNQDMNASALRKRLISMLDPRSSHPSTLPHRARVFMILAAIPAAMLILGFLFLLGWSFLEPEAGIRMLLRTGMVLRFLVPLLGFLAGFAASGLLILLASKAAVTFREWRSKGGSSVAWLAVATLIVGLVGLLIINYSGDGRIEILGHVLMVLPFVSTISILVVIAERRRRGPVWWSWLGLPVVVFALLYLSVMTGSGARWMAEAIEDAIGPILNQLRADGLLGDIEHTIRAITAILLFSGLGLWAVLWSPWEPDHSDRRDKSSSGILRRIWRILSAPFAWLRKLFGVDDEESGTQEPPDASVWIDEILAAQAQRSWRWEEIPARVDDDPGGFVGAVDGASIIGLDPVWGGLFLDAPIAADQSAVIETFVGTREESLDRPLRPGVLPDLMLEADRGGGGLETLAAAVVAVVLIRGQGALIVVPNDDVLRRLRDRIRSILAHVQVDGLISCESITDRRGISAEGVDVAQILVGRLEDVEACFFDAALDDGARRTLLAGLGGVFIAGLMEFAEEDRLEISLLIHKIRILHISIRSWVQVLVLTSPMGELGHLREQVRSSLFSRIHRNEVCRLRRRWVPEARVVLPIVDDENAFIAAVCDLASTCRPAWGRVLVVRAGISGEDAAALQRRVSADIEGRTGESPLVDVVGDAAMFEEVEVDESSAWVLVIEDGHTRSMQVAAELDLPRLGSRILWVSLTAEHAGALRVPGTRLGDVPVLGGDKTQGLWIRHAASLIELLQVSAPIERRDWGQFGLPRVGEIPDFGDLQNENLAASNAGVEGSDGRSDTLSIEIAAGFELECDPPDRRRRADFTRAGNERAGDQHTGVLEWVARPRNAQAMRGLSLDPERDHRVAMRGGRHIVAVRLRRPEGRIAIWHADAVDIPFRRRFDLARETSFQRLHQGSIFTPASVALDAEGRVRIRAEAQPPEHMRQAMRHSLWRADIDVGIRSGIEHWQATESTLQGDDVAFLECRALGRDRLTARMAGLRLCGLASDEGGRLGTSLDRFVYSAGLSVLCLGMGSARRLEQEGLSDGVWSTMDGGAATLDEGRRFDPLLTSVLHKVLNDRAPGIGMLGRLLVFHAPGGGTALVLLEPWDSMGAFWKVFKLMLKEDPLRRRIVKQSLDLMSDVIAETGEGRSLQLATAYHCGLGFDTDARHDPDAARRSLEIIERG